MKYEIESKYETGAKAWFINDREVIHGTLTKIKVVFSVDADPEIEYAFKCESLFVHYVPEANLFETKEELLESL